VSERDLDTLFTFTGVVFPIAVVTAALITASISPGIDPA